MFNLRSGNKPEFRKLSGVASPNKIVDATAVTDKLKEKVASVANVKDKLSSVKEKVSSKVSSAKDKAKDLVSKAATARDVVKTTASKAKNLVTPIAANIKNNPIVNKATQVLKNPAVKTTGKALGQVGKRFLGPAGAAMTVYDVGKMMHEQKHMPRQNLVRDAKVQKKYGGSYTMGAGK